MRGIIEFVMTLHDYKNNDLFPGALAFISLGNRRFAINITYVPKIVPKMVVFVYFPATFKIAVFQRFHATAL